MLGFLVIQTLGSNSGAEEGEGSRRTANARKWLYLLIYLL